MNFQTIKLKRWTAAAFILFAILDLFWLHWHPAHHWITIMTQKGVKSEVLIAVAGFKDALTWGALAVYGWAKAKGAD